MATGHFAPPCSAFVATGLERRLVPGLHDVEQSSQSRHKPMTQSIGHLCVLHESASWRCGQCLPPLLVWRVIARLRCFEPVAHDFVHCDQLPQSDTVQSTAQGAELHAYTPTFSGQSGAP